MGRTKQGFAGLNEGRSWLQLFVNALGDDRDVSYGVNFKADKRVIQSDFNRPNVFDSLSPDCSKKGTIFFDFADSFLGLANRCPVTFLLALVTNRGAILSRGPAISHSGRSDSTVNELAVSWKCHSNVQTSRLS